ncbi:terpenoid synthase [Hysterangium stoloniferum]|nr:terpenoid synthase [Hysterangium stoloniferum]
MVISHTTFRLPDFLSQCLFPLHYHPNGDFIAEASDQWYRNAFDVLSKEQERRLSVLKASNVAASIYDDASEHHLRVACDLMNLILLYGDLTDEIGVVNNKMAADLMMNALWFPNAYKPTHVEGKWQPNHEPAVGRLARDLWKRCVQDSKPGFRDRFIESMALFADARHVQADHREKHTVPSLDEYIDIRRNSSGLKPLIDILEYTLQIDLPSDVISHPTMDSLKECVNDFCTWSNDIFSFNKEQACGDTYNMVIILMETHALELQDAVDYVGDMCITTLDKFREYKQDLPKWGTEVDRDVARFIRGLENWLIACLHWSFISGRYFGAQGLVARDTLTVELLPKKNRVKGAKEKGKSSLC